MISWTELFRLAFRKSFTVLGTSLPQNRQIFGGLPARWDKHGTYSVALSFITAVTSSSTKGGIVFRINIDSKDDYSWTPLAQAADNGHKAVMQLLLGIAAAWNRQG